MMLLLHLPLPLLPPPPSSKSSPLFPMFLLLPLSSLLPLLRPPLPQPLDLPLRSLHSLLQNNLDSDLDLDLDLVVYAPKSEVPLDLFLVLLQGDLKLDPDLVLVSQENPTIPLPSSLSPPPLSPQPFSLMRLQQPRPPLPIHPDDFYLPLVSADSVHTKRTACPPSSSADCLILYVTDSSPSTPPHPPHF